VNRISIKLRTVHFCDYPALMTPHYGLVVELVVQDSWCLRRFDPLRSAPVENEIPAVARLRIER